MYVKFLIESNLTSVEVRQNLLNESYSANKWVNLFKGVSVKYIKKSFTSIINSSDFKYLSVNKINAINSIELKKSKPLEFTGSLILIQSESVIEINSSISSDKIKTLKHNLSLVSLTGSANVEFKLISPSKLVMYQLM